MPPARRHFWTVVNRGAGGCLTPEKYGFSGCMPAEMKSVDGSSGGGISGNDGKRRWSRSSKNERKPSRSSAVVRIGAIVAACRDARLRRARARDASRGARATGRRVGSSGSGTGGRMRGFGTGSSGGTGAGRASASGGAARVGFGSARGRVGSAALSWRRPAGVAEVLVRGRASRRRAASFAAAVASPKFFGLRNGEKPCAIPAASPETFSTGFAIAVETARTAVSALSAIETALSVTVSSLSSW